MSRHWRCEPEPPKIQTENVGLQVPDQQGYPTWFPVWPLPLVTQVRHPIPKKAASQLRLLNQFKHLRQFFGLKVQNGCSGMFYFICSFLLYLTLGYTQRHVCQSHPVRQPALRPTAGVLLKQGRQTPSAHRLSPGPL